MNEKPVIGIMVCGIEREKQFVSSAYIHAIEESGGIPFIIPVSNSIDFPQIYFEICSGYLFCGGIDISPVFFNEEPLPGLGKTCLPVDRYQIAFMKKVLELRVPILAVCRGMQILCVARGGSIFQDICLQPGNHLKHMQMTQSRSEGSHQVQVFPHSRLADIVGENIYTNSYHHQTVRRPGDGLTISAQTADRTIEALEMEDHPFCIGVQWHPECMYQTNESARNLFCSFVEACRE